MLVIRDVPLADPLESALLAQGFFCVASRPTFVLSIEEPSLQAFLTAMTSSHRRRARHSLARPLEVQLVSDFAELSEDMAALFAEQAARSTESRNENIDAELLRAWARVPGTAALIVRAESGERAVALFLADSPVLHFLRCGFDKVAAVEHGLYFRLLYELVRVAIESGCSYLDLGVTSADPKLRLGAEPLDLRVWTRHRHRGAHMVLRGLSRYVSSSAAVLPRHRVFSRPREKLVPSWYRSIS